MTRSRIPYYISDRVITAANVVRTQEEMDRIAREITNATRHPDFFREAPQMTTNQTGPTNPALEIEIPTRRLEEDRSEEHRRMIDLLADPVRPNHLYTPIFEDNAQVEVVVRPTVQFTPTIGTIEREAVTDQTWNATDQEWDGTDEPTEDRAQETGPDITDNFVRGAGDGRVTLEGISASASRFFSERELCKANKVPLTGVERVDSILYASRCYSFLENYALMCLTKNQDPDLSRALDVFHSITDIIQDDCEVQFEEE